MESGSAIAGNRAPATTPTVTGVDADTGLVAVAFMTLPHIAKLLPDELAAAKGRVWTGEQEFIGIHTIGTYLPVFYLPAVAGLGTAKLLGAGPFVSVLTGRLAALTTFLLMGVTALLVARRGQLLLLCTLGFPMTLSLAASFNQDGELIGASVLAAALLTRTDERLLSPARVGAALLLALVVAVKPPYAPLLAGLLLPLPRVDRWRHEHRRLGARLGLVFLAALPMLLWLVFVMPGAAAPGPREAYAAGPLWPGPRPTIFTGTDMGAQLRVLLAKPTRLFKLPWHYLVADDSLQTRRLLAGAVGILGWYDLSLANAVLLAVGSLQSSRGLQAGCLRRSDIPATVRWSDLALMLIATLVALWLVLLSQYISYTDVGFNEIWGPMGRYLLPLPPFLAIAIPSVSLRAAQRWQLALIAVPALALVFGLARLQPLIVKTYYLRSGPHSLL